MSRTATSCPARQPLILAAVVLLLTAAALAQHERSFPFDELDGSHPLSGMTADAAGNLYGMTQLGGIGSGVVYELSPAVPPSSGWKETSIYEFNDTMGGAFPVGDLAIDGLGNLYGTTAEGGSGGSGTVFELSPPSQPGGTWTETDLYDFGTWLGDGAGPMAGLVFDAVGNLYGTTESGGSAGYGTVFELSPPSSQGGAWSETILHNFAYIDGAYPEAPLVLDSARNLYGTSDGGTPGGGIVFELAPPSQPGEAWTETVLHNFGIGDDGAGPHAGLTLTPSGALLGVTESGGPSESGVAFELSPQDSQGSRTYQVIYSSGGSASLTLNGRVLYSTTPGTVGLVPNSVYQLTPPTSRGGPWTETTLYVFTGGKDGGDPEARVLVHDGALYGTASDGGVNDHGTIFVLSP